MSLNASSETARVSQFGSTQLIASTLLLAACVTYFSAGCTSYEAGGAEESLDQYTYESTSTFPQSISIVDTRTSDLVWAMDIPVGQQLTIKFNDDVKRSNRVGYDEMTWGLNPVGGSGRSLSNTMRVPPRSARRIDGALRE